MGEVIFFLNALHCNFTKKIIQRFWTTVTETGRLESAMFCLRSITLHGIKKITEQLLLSLEL